MNVQLKERSGAFDPPIDYKPDGAALPVIDADEFVKVVETRRSVRRFTEEVVPDAIIRRCLDLALLSANSCNLQPWEFVAIKTPEIRAEVNRACLKQNAVRTAPALLAIVARTDTFRQNAADMLDHWPEPEIPKPVRAAFSTTMPFQYSLGWCGLKGLYKRFLYWKASRQSPTWRGPVNRAERREWATKTTALAAQTLMLALRAFGYDTCPIEGFDRPLAKRILNLSEGEEIIMFIAIGKRAGNGIYHKRARLPNDRFIREV